MTAQPAPDFRHTTAERLRQLAAETEDEGRAQALQEAAEEWDGFALTGAADPRAAA